MHEPLSVRHPRELVGVLAVEHRTGDWGSLRNGAVEERDVDPVAGAGRRCGHRAPDASQLRPGGGHAGGCRNAGFGQEAIARRRDPDAAGESAREGTGAVVADLIRDIGDAHGRLEQQVLGLVEPDGSQEPAGRGAGDAAEDPREVEPAEHRHARHLFEGQRLVVPVPHIGDHAFDSCLHSSSLELLTKLVARHLGRTPSRVSKRGQAIGDGRGLAIHFATPY